MFNAVSQAWCVGRGSDWDAHPASPHGRQARVRPHRSGYRYTNIRTPMSATTPSRRFGAGRDGHPAAGPARAGPRPGARRGRRRPAGTARGRAWRAPLLAPRPPRFRATGPPASGPRRGGKGPGRGEGGEETTVASELRPRGACRARLGREALPEIEEEHRHGHSRLRRRRWSRCSCPARPRRGCAGRVRSISRGTHGDAHGPDEPL